MTRKSPPKTQILNRLAPVVLVCATVALTGCSLLSPKKSLLSGYEETRNNIENPVGVGGTAGVYRPEGVSAEREGSAVDFFQRVGIRAKRRKNISVAQSHYADAEKEFETAKSLEGEPRAAGFRKAAKQYDLAANNWQSSGLEQDALMMSAESHFFAEDYYQAEQLYAKLIKEYPRTPYLDHVDSRRFEIADYWLKVDSVKKSPFVIVNFTDNRLPWNDTGGHGKRVLEAVRLDNPTGKISDDATMRLAMQQYEGGKYENAADTFADLRMTYPDSEHQFNAQYLEMQSLLESYQGPKYSSVPIVNAQKRIKQLAKQFPNEASERDQDLQQAYAKIRYLMAQRIWVQAKYRRNRAENGSAKFHYNRILKEYADTPFAEQAQQALAAVQDAPDDPPQRFKALVWMFGADTNDRPWRDDANAQ